MVHLYIQEKDFHITDLQNELRYVDKTPGASIRARPSGRVRGHVRLGPSIWACPKIIWESEPVLETSFLKYLKIFEFSEVKMEKRELEGNLTSIRIELSENEHLKLEAETKRDDLAKVSFRNDIVISFW